MNTKERLIRELTEANGSPEWSRNMAERIERGELILPSTHTDMAHALAKKLRAESLDSTVVAAPR